MTTSATTTVLSLNVTKELSGRLGILAQKTGRTKSFYVRQLIEEHIEDIEDLYLAEQEMEAIRTGKSTTIPLDEVAKGYGMAD